MAQSRANGGLRFLIIEDEATGAAVLEAFLSSYGECRTARDGVEGLDAFRESVEHDDPYDLICLDIMMPVMDGISVLREIRRIESERQQDAVKVVMTTALTTREHVMAAVEDGACAFLVKPIEKAKLLAKLRDLGLIEA